MATPLDGTAVRAPCPSRVFEELGASNRVVARELALPDDLEASWSVGANVLPPDSRRDGPLPGRVAGRYSVAHFVVINGQGPAWDNTRSMRDQSGWAEHASFMNQLAEERFVVLGGPLTGGAKHRAMLIVEATDERSARQRLAEDPWMRAGVLRILTLDPWEVLLGDPTGHGSR